MAESRAKDYSPNPDFNRPVQRNPEADKAALRAYFKAAGTPEAFYLSYPAERPPEPLPPPVQSKPYGERLAERMEARETTTPAPRQRDISR